MSAESLTSRIGRSLVAMGAFGAASYVRRHPELARERLLMLREKLVDQGDDRVKYVDRGLRLLARSGPIYP